MTENKSREQIMQEYMDASAELHEAGVKHMTSLTDKEFCDWVIDVVNGDGRDSMKFAVLREGAIERLEGLNGL